MIQMMMMMILMTRIKAVVPKEEAEIKVEDLNLTNCWRLLILPSILKQLRLKERGRDCRSLAGSVLWRLTAPTLGVRPAASQWEDPTRGRMYLRRVRDRGRSS